MNWIILHSSDIVDITTKIIASAAAIAALTPSPKDDSAIAWVRQVIDTFALNFGNAKNDSGKK